MENSLKNKFVQFSADINKQMNVLTIENGGTINLGNQAINETFSFRKGTSFNRLKIDKDGFLQLYYTDEVGEQTVRVSQLTLDELELIASRIVD